MGVSVESGRKNVEKRVKAPEILLSPESWFLGHHKKYNFYKVLSQKMDYKRCL